MARSVEEINDYIVTALVNNFSAIGITIDPNIWSKRNFFRLLCYSVAIGQALLEQLMDAFKAAIEAISKKSAAASPLWVQAKMFEFQYDETNTQFVILKDTTPQYPVIDETLRIITACSVTSPISGAVTVKVAQTISGVLAKLNTNQKNAAQGYLNTIGTAGIIYTVQSDDPDQIYIEADIYFQGQFDPVIRQQVKDTWAAFLKDQSVSNFNGNIKMSALENAVRDMEGVNDIILKNVRGRKSSDPFISGVDLILNTAILQRQYVSNAGYNILETTSGKTLDDTLNFIAE